MMGVSNSEYIEIPQYASQHDRNYNTPIVILKGGCTPLPLGGGIQDIFTTPWPLTLWYKSLKTAGSDFKEKISR